MSRWWGPVLRGLPRPASSPRRGFPSRFLTGQATAAQDDPRTIALMQPSIRLLAHLGLWPGDLMAQSAPLWRLKLVDDSAGLVSGGPGPVVFDAREIGDEPFGWNIPIGALTAALEQRARGWAQPSSPTRRCACRPRARRPCCAPQAAPPSAPMWCWAPTGALAHARRCADRHRRVVLRPGCAGFELCSQRAAFRHLGGVSQVSRPAHHRADARRALKPGVAGAARARRRARRRKSDEDFARTCRRSFMASWGSFPASAPASSFPCTA
jgi:hypothetical protein